MDLELAAELSCNVDFAKLLATLATIDFNDVIDASLMRRL